MDVPTARKTLGKIADRYTDREVQEIINTLEILADVCIDQFFATTPEEQKKMIWLYTSIIFRV